MNKKEKSQYKKKLISYLKATEDVDVSMIKDCLNNYINDKIDYTNKVCLDLGANIGGFSKLAIDLGASKVISVECDSRNYNKLLDSFKYESKVKVLCGAVSASEESTLKIYKSHSKQNHCSTSILQRKNFEEYDEVQNFNIQYLLDTYKPDIIKIDIEGAEYQIIEYIEEYYPEVLFLEMHMGKVKQYCEPTLNRLREIYPINDIQELIVFKTLAGYDCFFKKENKQ